MSGLTEDTTGRLIAASKVTGTDVYDPAGTKIGNIYDLVLSKATGAAQYAIMSFGGFLGMGKDYHPLPWSMLHYSPEKDGYVANVDIDLIKAAPSLGIEQIATVWGDPAYGHTITRYYIR
jgi:sporulation protein YlmC with PRC-barrel domain